MSGLLTKKKVNDFLVYGLGQAINLLSPLIVIPYLISVCGETGLGKIGVGFSIALILNSIIDYGSYIIGVKEISIRRDDNEFVAEKALAIYSSKILLFGILSLLAIVAFTTIPFLYNDKELYILSLAIVLGQLINPAWFFQGIENYKWLSFTNILSKAIYLLLIYLLVDKESDYIWVNLFFGVGAIVSNTVALAYISMQYKLSLRRINFKAGIKILKEEFRLSLSQVFLSLYQYVPIVIISFLIGNYFAGQYRVIDQVIAILKSYLVIFFYFVFANICYEVNSDSKRGIKVWGIYNSLNLIFILLILVSFYFATPFILSFFKLHPDDINEVATIFRIGLLVPLLVAISLPLRQLMFAFDENDVYIKITIITTVLNICLLFLLIPAYGLTGAIISVLIIEFIVIALYLLILNKHFKKAFYNDR